MARFSLASFEAKQWIGKIDRADSAKGGSSKRATAQPVRVRTCKCPDGAMCDHARVEHKLAPKSPKALLRDFLFEHNEDRYDPVTHIKRPTAFGAICPRCGLFNCGCGRAAEVEARLAKLKADSAAHSVEFAKSAETTAL